MSCNYNEPFMCQKLFSNNKKIDVRFLTIKFTKLAEWTGSVLYSSPSLFPDFTRWGKCGNICSQSPEKFKNSILSAAARRGFGNKTVLPGHIFLLVKQHLFQLYE